MDYTTDCMQCGKPLEGKRRGALFCKDRCRKRFDRWQNKAEANGYDPSVSRTSALTESRADATFRAQLASHQIASEPLTDEERILLARQRRNRGVMLPQVRDKLLEHELERMRLEAAEVARATPVKVEDRFDPSSLGSLTRRAAQSRNRNKPQDPHERILRPGVPGPARYPGDLPETIDGPPRNTPRWLM